MHGTLIASRLLRGGAWESIVYLKCVTCFVARAYRRVVPLSNPHLPRPPHKYPQDAGVEVGDTLQAVDGTELGSYKQGMALFKKQKGTFKLTVLREEDITI